MTEIRHLDYVTRTDPQTNQTYPETGRRRIFISYKKSDSQKTSIRDKAIEKILRLADVAVWYDKNLTPGEDYNDEIQRAINECDAVVLLLTKDILASDYVWDVEIKLAKERKKAIIPIAFSNIKDKDYPKIEEKLGSVQILKWADDDSDDQETEDFDSDFKRALDRFVVNMDFAKEVESFFNAGNDKINSSNLTARQLYLMGCGYIRGIGTAEDDGKGIEILRAVSDSYGSDPESIDLKSKASLELSSYCLKSGDREGAFEYTRKAAELGNSSAQYYLGNMYYYSGRGIEQNRQLAVEWYKKAAADEGMDGAMYQLGKAYYYGRGVEKDLRSAAEWYRKAAEKGNASAMYAYAEMLRLGKDAEADLQEAAKWHERAADAGNASSMIALGRMYEKGTGVELSNKKAFEYYKNAVESGGSNTAYIKLGDMYYRDGEGTEDEIEKARELYKTAADNGSKTARESLEKLRAKFPDKEAAPCAGDTADNTTAGTETPDTALTQDTAVVQDKPAEITEEAETVPAPDTAAVSGNPTEPAVKRSAARWLVPLIILLALAAAAIVQLAGIYDILGLLSELFGITG